MLRKIYKLCLLVTALTGSSLALANDIYMEQIGTANVVTITQQGAGNTINSGGVASTSRALLNAQGSTVLIDQLGSGNTLSLIMNNPNLAAAGLGTMLTSKADGSGNEQTITCGSSVAATCNAATITQDITGNDNIVTTSLAGGAASSIITLVGNLNQVTHTATGAGTHTANINIGSVGPAHSNIVSVTQSGTLAKNVSINSDGSNNNIAIIQSN